MRTIIQQATTQCNNYFNQKAVCARFGSANLEYARNLIKASSYIEMHKSVFGLFSVMAETCLTYSKSKCFKRQTTLGYENKHKPLGERQTRTHQRTLLGLGMFERDHRPNKRLPYEHAISDLGIVYYLIKVKKVTNEREIAEIIGRFRKLPVEKIENCRSQEDKIIEDIKIRDCIKIEQKKEPPEREFTPAERLAILQTIKTKRESMRI